MLTHMSLILHFEFMFALQQSGYNTDEVNSWLPYEREIYASLLERRNREKNE